VKWGVGAFRRPSRTETEPPEQGGEQLPLCCATGRYNTLILFISKYFFIYGRWGNWTPI